MKPSVPKLIKIKTTYRDNPITCDYCFFKVEVDDPRTCSIDKKTGKKFCSYSCFSKFIDNEVDKEQHEERMKQMAEEIHQTIEQAKKGNKDGQQSKGTKTNQATEKGHSEAKQTAEN